jgi:acetylornithine deacetylase/succinyl-diaminopimelate desuccinylase-like protein
VNFDLVKTLAELVAIPSVNPMGRDVTGPQFYEHRLTEYLERFFGALGLPVERQTIDPLRDNIIARLDGDDDAPVLLWDAHQDTVPVEGMTIDPFGATIQQGRLYGRGACDIKGGLAAMLAAFARLAEERPPRRPTVLMACTVNEEHGFTGAEGLCRLWSEGAKSIFPRRPDMAIVAEPTRLDVVVAHKGMVRWRCQTVGRAAHSSQPQLGQNAIFRMAPVLTALAHYQLEVLPRLNEHPLCGRPTLSVGTIHGGTSVNTVPDLCTIEIDRRLLPGDDPQDAYQHVIDFLRENAADSGRLEHLPPMMRSRGLSNDNNGALADRLAATVRESRRSVRQIGVPFGTNAAAFGAHCPTVVFGPGSIDQAHTADEWIALEELELASEILYRFAKRNAE